MNPGYGMRHFGTSSEYSPFRDYLGLAGLIGRGVLLAPARDDKVHYDMSTKYGVDFHADAHSHNERNINIPTPHVLDAECPPKLVRPPPSAHFVRKALEQTICAFCKSNDESRAIYASHVLKNHDGVIICPILRAYTCPICSLSGDEAHTISYCPKGIQDPILKKLIKVSLKLKQLDV